MAQGGEDIIFESWDGGLAEIISIVVGPPSQQLLHGAPEFGLLGKT